MPLIRTIEIRPARREDLPAIDTLLSRAYPQLLKNDYPPSVLVTAVPLISRAQPGLVSSGTYYVAVAETGAILGAGGWTARDPATGRSTARLGNIRHFGTDPDATRRGVARHIMDRCLRDAQDAGVTRMQCYSTLTAVPFYAAQGFVELAEVELELRPGVRFSAIRMERRLS